MLFGLSEKDGRRDPTTGVEELLSIMTFSLLSLPIKLFIIYLCVGD